MDATYYNATKDYLHPSIHSLVDHYRSGDLIDLPPFHGCNHINRDGTRKLMKYEMGEQYILPTWKRYWRKPKTKFGRQIGFCYWTRYLTQTRFKYLFKNKGNFVYNYKHKRYGHMNETSMHYEFKYIQEIRKDLMKNVLA